MNSKQSAMPTVANIPCCAMNLDDLSPEFVKFLPEIERKGLLLIRSIADESPNVVINLSDVEQISETHPDEYQLFLNLAKDYQYVFVSMDF